MIYPVFGFPVQSNQTCVIFQAFSVDAIYFYAANKLVVKRSVVILIAGKDACATNKACNFFQKD
jgi:hypothetical protein